MAVAGEHPMRRSTDLGPGARFREWWRENGVPAVMFMLLGVIVLGELSDFINDRAQERTFDSLVCSVGNLSEQSAESVKRLREQAPTMLAARRFLAAETDADRIAAIEELRRVGAPEPTTADLSEPEDCPAP